MRKFSELQISVPEQVLFRDLGGESVLLHLGSGQYFGLDEIGTLIWSLLAAGASLKEIEERLLSEYDATPEKVRDDVSRLVEELRKSGLLEVGDSAR